jgi:periplasmic divalent cation tolerance protein
MDENRKPILVMVTAPDISAARAVASTLVEKRIAACVNISPSWHSIYHWEGKIQEDSEVLLLIKTTRRHFDGDLIQTIQEKHPYDLPEIIVLPIVAGEKNYLDWIIKETGG